MIKLLLIEDDVNLGYIIQSSLEHIIGGYEVCIANNGQEGLEALSKTTPDIIVSDIDMPVMDGIEMVKKIRAANNNIPIFFATGKNSPKDVTEGYAAGVNNYIKKPFSPEELDAHIKALLTTLKQNLSDKNKEKIYKIGKYIFNPGHYYLEYEAERQKLSSRESQILVLFCENIGNVVPRNEILMKYWGANDYFPSRSLDVFISKIRGYLSKDTSVSIKNIKGVGLMLEVE